MNKNTLSLSSNLSKTDAQRVRLAIVSTYDELCGIAGYTRALVRQLEPWMDITVFDLDQYMLRGTHERVQRMGDRHIREIASQLSNFDCVNIQLEHGTLGRMPKRIFRRFRMLANKAPALSVTFHTVLGDGGLPWEEMWRHLRRGSINTAAATLANSVRATQLSRGIYGLLRRLQRRKSVHVIVHTKRDMRLLRDVFRLKNVHHHPLSFINQEKAAEIRKTASRSALPALAQLPPNARLVGAFGFLSPYKGFETAIRALRQLPKDYHLLIFGGVHPQTIRRNEPIDPYVGMLLDEGRIGETMLADLSAAGLSAISVAASAEELLGKHPGDLGDRIHFMGVVGDEDFASAMAICDVVVMPYMEVGQSSSGPIALALEMGCSVIAARNLAFLQYARYHPGEIEFFDIGNFHELAQRIMAARPAPADKRRLTFNTATNAALYTLTNTPSRVPDKRGASPENEPASDRSHFTLFAR